MFYEDDYPSWIGTLFASLGCDDKDLEDNVFRIVKEQETPPHIGNIIADLLLCEIENKIIELAKTEELIFRKYINGMDTHFSINGISVTDKSGVLNIIEEFEKAA